MTSALFFAIGLISLAKAAGALTPKQEVGSLESLAFVSETLQAGPLPEAIDDLRVTAASSIVNTWESFRVTHGDWKAIVDKRTGKVESAEGEGIPFVPGRGNQLQMADLSVALGGDQDIDLTKMEAITRAFLPSVARLLGVDPSDLVLNQGRSGHPAEYLWFVDFDVTRDGMPIEGARIVFRVNNGNLIQFGSENLPAEGIEAPKAKVPRNQALSILAEYIGGFSAADAFLDGGSQHFIPVALADSQFDEGFEQPKGRGLARVWQFVFRRGGSYGTWRARVDATSGKLLELRDLNDYASAQVAGGVTSLNGTENRPMPFADVSSGGYTNSAGVYEYTSGTVSSALNGQYVKINDSCGAISLTSDASGNLAFGDSSGTDCETPGYGGPGNTNASRTQFYHLNRAKEIARGWINLPWLTSQVTANVNLPDGICNAFWDGAAINFIRRGTGCSNSGQIQGVGLHEFGHGLDTNDGNGPSPDKGTGETYGDWTATLITHDSCIGAGLLASNCDGYGDACTSCTGVRDIDYAKHSSGAPHTVGNFTQVLCPTGNGYNGPCGREGHCESQVSSEALWDLTVRDLPNPGTASAWAIMDRLWYLSRPTATAAFTCFKASSPWTSDGCGTGSLWKTMRAVDDDDGNLSNGTPHSAALYAAFNRHGIACTSDAGANTNFRGCTQPAIPNLSLAASNNQVMLSWSGSSGVYDIFRNEQGCNAGGFIKVANDVTSSSFIDENVANDSTYYYQVVAQPGSNEACASMPSPCLEATPCLTPTAPFSLTATVLSANQINLSWTDSTGATRYHVYRATNSGGPFTQVGTRSGTTFYDTGLTACTAYYYVVRAAGNDTCESANSVQSIGVTTGGCSLSVLKSNADGGTVTSSPAGINCGADCSEPYSHNTLVTLTATPATGFAFSGWSGACTGTGTCAVTMTQARSVTALFSEAFVLTLYPGGPGTVTSVPSGINCGLDCTETYPKDTMVTLTATPEEGALFHTWGGGPCDAVDELGYSLTWCTVPMTKAWGISASFNKPYLAVNTDGPGTVTSTPSGINCKADCIEYYDSNTLVTLTATPAAGAIFVGWDWGCTGTGPCTVTVQGRHYVHAIFLIPSILVNVYPRDPLAQGMVTSATAGTGVYNMINCPEDSCFDQYDYNTRVELTATPAEGTVFSGWTGGCTGTDTTCILTMTQSFQVGANFDSVHLLATSLAGAGSGTVKSTPAGINCGTDCNETYVYGTQVTLTRTPSTGSVFSGWSGACTGTGPCTVTMTQAHSVTATFSVTALTVSLAGAGSGTVTSTPAGINCGADCNEVYNYNTQVTLTATPAAGSVFSGWNGACTGTGTCTVTMTQARSVTATFSVATHTLTVSLVGAGSGMVTSTPGGINCGEDCGEAYNYNTPVALTATPSSVLFVFEGWSGACTGTGTCNVTMDQAKSVTATFDDKGQDFYTVSPCRVYDTRVTGNPLTSEVPRIINVTGTCGVPATAKAVSLNLTALMAPGAGFITLYPGDTTQPSTWTIGFSPLLNRANNAVIPLAWNGDGTLAALAVISGGGSMDMALDVDGYFE